MNFNFELPLWLGIILCVIFIIEKLLNIFSNEKFDKICRKIILILFYKNNKHLYKNKMATKNANKTLKAQIENERKTQKVINKLKNNKET